MGECIENGKMAEFLEHEEKCPKDSRIKRDVHNKRIHELLWTI